MKTTFKKGNICKYSVPVDPHEESTLLIVLEDEKELVSVCLLSDLTNEHHVPTYEFLSYHLTVVAESMDVYISYLNKVKK